MAADSVFPPEMPDNPFDPTAPFDGLAFDRVALDGDTAERLLAGRLDPDDAPPGLAEVAMVLRAAAGPPCPDELAGQPAALATFRRLRHRARVRSRLVTVALAGTLAIGGLWIADGAQSPLGLLSPSGGPGTGGPGSGAPAGAPGSGAPADAPGSGGPGLGGVGSEPALRPSSSPVGSGTEAGGGGGSPRLPSTRERAIAGHRGGGPSRGGGSAAGVRPAAPGKGQAAKPPKPSKAEPGKAEPGKAEKGGGKRK
jgi:hypothetical protein